MEHIKIRCSQSFKNEKVNWEEGALLARKVCVITRSFLSSRPLRFAPHHLQKIHLLCEPPADFQEEIWVQVGCTVLPMNS